MRILIAEDDEALARFVRQGLEGEHYTVDAFKDGEQSLSAALAGDYAAVILDLNLPKLDGVAVLRQLRMKKPSLPILILTQRTRVEDRVQCLDTGADDYLAKPFSFSELSARIRALIRRSHLPSESVLTVADLKIDRVQRIVESRWTHDRAHGQGIFSAGISDAPRRLQCHALHDHQACVESYF